MVNEPLAVTVMLPPLAMPAVELRITAPEAIVVSAPATLIDPPGPAPRVCAAMLAPFWMVNDPAVTLIAPPAPAGVGFPEGPVNPAASVVELIEVELPVEQHQFAVIAIGPPAPLPWAELVRVRPIGQRELPGRHSEPPRVARSNAAGQHCGGIRRDDAGWSGGDDHPGAAAAAISYGVYIGAIGQRDLGCRRAGRASRRNPNRNCRRRSRWHRSSRPRSG